jgi:ribosome-associated toxin RatA of RatAB toxin-antitoxin module
MRDVKRSALVPHTPSQMYALVNAVGDYPRFVPWCTGARVLTETATALSATLEVGRAGVGVALTTQNTLKPNERIDMALLDGPFRTFSGVWRFVPITEVSGEGAPVRLKGCRVELVVSFEFKNAALDLLAGPLFESTWNSLVDVFVTRAREVYGATR